MNWLEEKWPRRRVTIELNDIQAKLLKTESGCQVAYALGVFQVENDSETNPYFICELKNGRCAYVDPAKVRFIDTDAKGVIVE